MNSKGTTGMNDNGPFWWVSLLATCVLTVNMLLYVLSRVHVAVVEQEDQQGNQDKKWEQMSPGMFLNV